MSLDVRGTVRIRVAKDMGDHCPTPTWAPLWLRGFTLGETRPTELFGLVLPGGIESGMRSNLSKAGCLASVHPPEQQTPARHCWSRANLIRRDEQFQFPSDVQLPTGRIYADYLFSTDGPNISAARTAAMVSCCHPLPYPHGPSTMHEMWTATK